MSDDDALFLSSQVTFTPLVNVFSESVRESSIMYQRGRFLHSHVSLRFNCIVCVFVRGFYGQFGASFLLVVKAEDVAAENVDGFDRKGQISIVNSKSPYK